MVSHKHWDFFLNDNFRAKIGEFYGRLINTKNMKTEKFPITYSCIIPSFVNQISASLAISTVAHMV